MFAKFIGRRATAVATALAVVVGLAITPAFTATAAEGDEAVIVPQVTEVVEETAPLTEPPAVAPVAEPVAPPIAPPAPPVLEAPPAAEPAAPIEESTPPAPQQLTRPGAAAESQSLAIQAASISPSSIGNFTVAAPVDIQFSGVDAERWRVVLDGFTGVNMSTSGHLTGSFSRVGSHSLTVQAQNHHWLWGWRTVESKRYAFSVLPVVNTTSLPDATVGVAYSQTIDATRNDEIFVEDSFTVVSGTLPTGLSLSGSTGKITGTVSTIPTSPVTYNFAVRLTHDFWFGGSFDSAPQPLSITVGYPAPVVTTSTLPIATVGAAYPSTQLTASGDGIITWSATDLPAGLELNPATGIISGTPHYNPAFGASTTVPVTVAANNGRSSAPQALSLTVNTPAPVFGSRVLPDATVGVLYDQQLSVTDGHGVLDYALVGGTTLPAGLELTADGRIYGTPLYNSSAGASKQVNFRVKVEGTAGSDRRGFVLDLLTPAPVIATATLPDGWWKQPYNQPILVSGPGVTVTVDGLPSGLRLEGMSIVGKTRSTGPHPLTITAVNTAGEVHQDVTLIINDKPDLFRMPVVKMETGEAFWGYPGLDGKQVTLALGADAPAGMTLDSNKRLDWTPTAPGVYKFMITATNPAGTDTQKYTFKVFDAPVITHGALDQVVINMPFRQKLEHDGTNVKFTIVRGELPEGLKLTRKGVITGTATEAGVFRIKVRAENAIDRDSRWFKLTVLEPAMTLSKGTIIRGNSLTVSGSGYLPGDTLELWLHSTPVLLGTVTATDGTFTSTVKIPANTASGQHHLVVNAAQSGTQSVPLTVGTPPVKPQQPQSEPQSGSQTGTQGAPQGEQPVATLNEEAADAPASSEVEENDVEADESEKEELPTLDQPEADEDAAAEAPANLSALLYAAFALLLAALVFWFILWRRRKATEN